MLFVKPKSIFYAINFDSLGGKTALRRAVDNKNMTMVHMLERNL